MTMKTTASIATAAGSLIFAAPAMATAPPISVGPQPSVSVTPQVDVAHGVCKARVNAILQPGTGIQVNVDNRGTQDDGRLLNDNGDKITVQGGTFQFDFSLPLGGQHVVGVQTFNPRYTSPVVNMDCRNPVPPTVVERVVPGPERVVNVPGKTITKRVKVKTKVVCEHRWSRKAHKIVIVKGTCHKPPKRRHRVHAKAPGTVQLPVFTG